jgi:hypothetical protein
MPRSHVQQLEGPRCGKRERRILSELALRAMLLAAAPSIETKLNPILDWTAK